MGAPTDPNQPPYGQPQPPPAPPPYDQPQQPPAQPPAAPPPAQPPQPAQPAAVGSTEGWAVKRGIVRVVVFLFGGTYLFWWFYKTRPKVTGDSLFAGDVECGQTREGFLDGSGPGRVPNVCVLRG